MYVRGKTIARVEGKVALRVSVATEDGYFNLKQVNGIDKIYISVKKCHTNIYNAILTEGGKRILKGVLWERLKVPLFFSERG